MPINKNLSYQGKFRTEKQLLASSSVDCLDIDNQFNFPDLTTKQTLIAKWSGQEWTKLISALSLGAFLTYGDDAVEIIETMLTVVGCPVELCSEIADCIESDIDVQASIANAIQSSSVIQSAIEQIMNDANQNGGNGNISQPLSPAIMATNIIPQGALCTNDNRYAMARAIVQHLDKMSEDFLDIIAVISNNAEIANEMVEAIPIFGSAVSIILDVAEWVNTSVRTSYSAAYNSTTELDFTCALYCEFEGCDLTWDGVIEAYEEQGAISPPTNTDFLTVMQWFVDNVVTNTDNLIVGSMHLFILNCLKYGSSWVGSGVWTTLEIAVQDAADEEITVPGSCNCPSAWCNLFDFTVSDQSFAVIGTDRPYGIYVPSVGWQTTYNNVSGINGNRTYPRRDFGVSFTPETWKVKYIGTTGGTGGSVAIVGWLNGSVVFSHIWNDYDTSGTLQELVYNNSHTVDEIRVQGLSAPTGVADQDAITLVSLEISATTGTPPEATNC